MARVTPCVIAMWMPTSAAPMTIPDPQTGTTNRSQPSTTWAERKDRRTERRKDGGGERERGGGGEEGWPGLPAEMSMLARKVGQN